MRGGKARDLMVVCVSLKECGDVVVFLFTEMTVAATKPVIVPVQGHL